MRTLLLSSLTKHPIAAHLRRAPNHLRQIPAAAAAAAQSLLPLTTNRYIHDLPSTPQPFSPSPSTILQPPPAAAAAAEDEPVNEFLSRFVWAMRPKLSDAYPSLSHETLDSMLLIICQKVVDAMDRPGSTPASTHDASPDGIILSPDLWATIWEVSRSVQEAMRRDRVREELKKYLHCDEVKEMCRFAGDVGIRGEFLRELRFKWAREKLEEVEFYRELDEMVEQGRKREEVVEEESVTKPEIEALPQRKGKIKYNVYGLDLSDNKWAEVAEKVEEAERHFVPEEANAKAIVGRYKKIDDKILALDVEDDLSSALAEWKDIIEPKRVDWLALLNRINNGQNLGLYFKVAELLLSEESFESNIRDYSKLIDAHSKADRLEDAERILQKMKERGIAPDVLTSIILVHLYSKVGNVDRAKEAFDSLKRNGFQPDIRAYNSMIMCYVKAGRPMEGELLIREMDKKDIKPTKEIYMELLRAFSECGHVVGAQRTVNLMQFSGIQPTLESSTLLVQAYGINDDPDQARGHFDQMIRTGHKPDDRCTARMMAAYLKKNLLDKALDLLINLEKDGFRPGIETYTVLVDWMGRLQLVDEAERLVGLIREMGDAPFEIHVSLCDMYSRSHELEKARKSLKVLEGRIELLRADQFERIITSLVGGGLLEDAERIRDLMVARGFPVSERIQVGLNTASVFRQKPTPTTFGPKPTPTTFGPKPTMRNAGNW